MNLQPQHKPNQQISTVGIMGSNQAAGFYYYDMPVSINGKQIAGNNSNTFGQKQDRNNIKKGSGSTGGLLL